MAGTSRFISLLATPFPTLVTHLRRPLLLQFPHLTCASRRLITRYTHTHLSPLSPIKASQQFHAQPINNSIPLNPTHPWPEWSSFITFLAGNAQLSPAVEDSFVAYEDFSHDYLTAATQCLAFARHRPDLIRSLSRKDIEVVVSNGTPFLFKAALETARRMRAFLAIDGSSVPDHDNANTVDLMKYILSYASKPTVSSGISSFYSRQLIESSCRNLLHELLEVSRGTPAVDLPLTEQRPTRQNIVMKRGDWVCQKCNFMNFARNNKCLECEEPRSRRQLTGGEWECPQCDYLNYGRNVVCLRCDSGRPAAASLRTTHFAYPNGNNPRLAVNDEKSQQWFSKMNNASDIDSDGEDFPEIMPLRKGENKFVVSTRKTPLERRLANSQFKRNNSTPEQTDESDKGKSSDYVPFVPLPSDMFDKKNETSIMDLKANPETSHQTISASVGNDLQSKERGEADKSESWFKKIAELHDVKDLPSAISDDDFPEIMPVRKGENRFVVSKKKDRSLTSPMYKRQVAMEQANNSNFVPFVPFPPGYFEKKDAQQPDSSSESISRNNGSPTTFSKTADVDKNTAQMPDDQFTSSNISRDEGVPTSCRNSDDKDVRSGWSGKSLEGSAVKEVDPLDMSEEAKAERWFRRVAQIKDISELSQIPDEDFPSIMPMRKGINRFVVSKRKTPLERRLTSTRYRRNLPVVTSDSLKTESDNGENEAT